MNQGWPKCAGLFGPIFARSAFSFERAMSLCMTTVRFDVLSCVKLGQMSSLLYQSANSRSRMAPMLFFNSNLLDSSLA